MNRDPRRTRRVPKGRDLAPLDPDGYARHQAAIDAICDRNRPEEVSDGTDHFNRYFDL
jgi:lysozyme family protein